MAFRHHHALFFALAVLFTAPLLLITVSARSLPNIPSTQKHKPWEAFDNFTKYQPGQKYKGLSDVKNYFHKFGYIPNANPLSNFTDDFDDTLVSAIQAYQNNYNLNVTGKLDETTLRHIAQPRCGVPDTINFRKKNAATTSFGNDKVHFHMVSHYAFFKGSPRWPAGTHKLTYAFADKLNSDYKAAFARAFNRWTPVVKITFQETASYQTANITIAFLRGDHGDGDPFDGPATGFSNNVLAHAFSPTNGRFHLDADEVWVASGDITKSTVETAVDLESVAVHEIGHLLGLQHSSDEKAIMYAYIPLKTRKVNLGEDDIQGIRALYGITN